MDTVRIELDENHLKIYESKHKESYALHPHQHDIHQILYAIDGHGEIMINEEWYEFSQDHAAIILPNTLHSVQSNSHLTVFVLAFSIEAKSSMLPVDFFPSYFPTSCIVRMEKNSSSELRHVFRKLLFLQSHSNSLNQIAARVQLCEVLLYLAKSKQFKTDSKFPAMVNRIKDYIDLHYYEIESASDIASKHHMSVRYMDNLFKEHFQKTPIHYLTEIRIARARELLEETNHEIISICFEVGFENVSTFYRCFKQFTGKTPHQYRTQ